MQYGCIFFCICYVHEMRDAEWSDSGVHFAHIHLCIELVYFYGFIFNTWPKQYINLILNLQVKAFCFFFFLSHFIRLSILCRLLVYLTATYLKPHCNFSVGLFTYFKCQLHTWNEPHEKKKVTNVPTKQQQYNRNRWERKTQIPLALYHRLVRYNFLFHLGKMFQ